MEPKDKKEAIAASIQAAKTIIDLLDSADYFGEHILVAAYDLLHELRQESEKLKDGN